VPVRYVSRRPRPPPPAVIQYGRAGGPTYLVAGVPGPRDALGPPAPPRRSHAAVLVAFVLLFAGWYLTAWTILVPALLSTVLLSSGVAFLGTRINPLSVGFYLTTKPSWTAIGTVFLSGVVLLGITYTAWKNGTAPILPQHMIP
jgi:hypothetical protein